MFSLQIGQSETNGLTLTLPVGDQKIVGTTLKWIQ